MAYLGSPQARSFRVVAKSFIGCIGPRLGSLPFHCNVLPGIVGPATLPGPVLRLLALAGVTDRMMCENPAHDRKDKAYRLYSACSFRVTCDEGKLIDVVASALDTDSGKEGPLQAPALIASPVSVARSADGFEFTWQARGRPHLAVEPGFQFVCPRTSLYIWHRVRGRVRCTPEGPSLSVNIFGSRFPSHRVYVDGAPAHSVPQQGFARLWFPATSAATRVD